MSVFLVTIISVALIFLLVWVLLGIGSWLQFKISFLHDPVYVPSTQSAIETIIQLAQPKKNAVVVDLGSGDGRLLLAFAQKGCRCIGYEINPVLVWKSNQLARKHTLQEKMTFYCTSFWQADVSQADIVILFTTASIMARLEKKLSSQLASRAKVISQRFRFPTWKHTTKLEDCYLYLKH